MVFDCGNEESLAPNIYTEVIDTALHIWKRDVRIKRWDLRALRAGNIKGSQQHYKGTDRMVLFRT